MTSPDRAQLRMLLTLPRSRRKRYTILTFWCDRPKCDDALCEVIRLPEGLALMYREPTPHPLDEQGDGETWQASTSRRRRLPVSVRNATRRSEYCATFLHPDPASELVTAVTCRCRTVEITHSKVHEHLVIGRKDVPMP